MDFAFNNRLFQSEAKKNSANINRRPMVSGVVPLSFLGSGKTATVQSIKGKDDTKRFLESLGFVEGAEVSVVSELGGNVIVNVKGTRVAISKLMAARIYTING